MAVGEERENATPVDTRGCASIELAPALGLESQDGLRQILAKATPEAVKILHPNALDESPVAL